MPVYSMIIPPPLMSTKFPEEVHVANSSSANTQSSSTAPCFSLKFASNHSTDLVSSKSLFLGFDGEQSAAVNINGSLVAADTLPFCDNPEEIESVLKQSESHPASPAPEKKSSACHNNHGANNNSPCIENVDVDAQVAKAIERVKAPLEKSGSLLRRLHKLHYNFVLSSGQRQLKEYVDIQRKEVCPGIAKKMAKLRYGSNSMSNPQLNTCFIESNETIDACHQFAAIYDSNIEGKELLEDDAPTDDEHSEFIPEPSIECPEVRTEQSPYEFTLVDTPQIPISQRADYRYLLAKTSIVARQTWLNRKLASVQMKLEKAKQLERQLKQCTETIKLGQSVASQNALPLSNNASTAVGDLFERAAAVADESCQSVRCRPLLNYRKRRIHQMSRIPLSKRARLTSVPCQCDPFSAFPPCPMCCGRPDYHPPPSAFPSAAIRDRIASFDTAFHAQLSSAQFLSLDVQFSRLQKSVLPVKITAPRLSGTSRDWLSHFRDFHTKNSSALLSPVTSTGLNKDSLAQVVEKEKKSISSTQAVAKKANVRNNNGSSRLKTRPSTTDSVISNSNNNSINTESRSLSSDSYETPHAQNQKKVNGSFAHNTPLSSRSSFIDTDPFALDNILIPASSFGGASMKLERLPYKEIVTPKWRKSSKRSKRKSEEADAVHLEKEECLDNCVFEQRHLEFEVKEKLRVSKLLSAGYGRSTNNRHRYDSTSNSGSLTPNIPFSPNASGQYLSLVEEGNNPSVSNESPVNSPVNPTDGLIPFQKPISVAPWPKRSFPLRN